MLNKGIEHITNSQTRNNKFISKIQQYKISVARIMTSALTYTGPAVICQNETIGAVAGAALGRWVAKILTAQGGAAVQACEEKKSMGV